MKQSVLLITVLSVCLSLIVNTNADEKKMSASERFNKAYKTLVNADQYRDKKEWSKALALYNDALDDYKTLSDQYPDWQSGMVKFRIKYCTDQISALMKRLGKAETEKNDEVPLTNTTADSSQTVEKLCEDARLLLREQRPAEAKEFLLEALRKDPDNEKTRLLIASAQCMLGEYDDALFIAKTLSEEFPSNTEAMLIMSSCYVGMDMFEEAEKELLKVLEINPQSTIANFNLKQLQSLKK